MATSMLGQAVPEVRRSDFVSWFHLRPVEPAPADAESTWKFRPEAPEFHEEVLFEVKTAAGRVDGLRLFVSRRLMDRPATALAARDIVQSFVALAFGDAPGLEMLKREIQFRDVPAAVLVGSPIELAAAPSPAFLAVVGRLSYAHLAEAGVEIAIYSDTLPWADQLVLSASPEIIDEDV